MLVVQFSVLDMHFIPQKIKLQHFRNNLVTFIDLFYLSRIR